MIGLKLVSLYPLACHLQISSPHPHLFQDWEDREDISLKPGQFETALACKDHQHVFCHVATGGGKTTIIKVSLTFHSIQLLAELNKWLVLVTEPLTEIVDTVKESAEISGICTRELPT